MVVSFLGIAIMVAVAALISWYRQAERQGGGPAPPPGEAGLCGGRRMRERLLLLALLMLGSGPVWAEQPVECRVAENLLGIKFPVAAGHARDRREASHCIGDRAGSSQLLPGPNGAANGLNGAGNAYPVRLQQALAQQLHGVDVKVTTDVKAKRTAAEMVKGLPAGFECDQARASRLADRNCGRDACDRSGSIQPRARQRHKHCAFGGG